MGQRTPTETLFGIVAAFVQRRSWSQADLARRLGTRTETIRARLTELERSGFQIERYADPPQVYWSVPKNWFPGVLPLTADEAKDLVRVLARTRRSELRERLLAVIVSRLSNLGHARPELDLAAFRAPEADEDEERWLAVVEDAVAKRVPVKLRYFTASRRHESSRHASVHRIDLARRTQLVATCHKANALRRFRLSNVLDARLDRNEAFRAADEAELRRFEEATFGGYHHDGPSFLCAFAVRDPESAWVARNLPDDRIVSEHMPDGIRFSIRTACVVVLARFVVGLGEAARSETPELAAAVASIARGALAGAG